MGTRRKSREYALQILFDIDFSHDKLGDIWNVFWESNVAEPDIIDFSKILVEGTLRNLKEIDTLLEEASTNWKLTRMAAVDRNIMRMAAYEIIHQKDIPPSVTINEAVEISKKFGTEDSPSFINGILDKVAKIALKNH